MHKKAKDKACRIGKEFALSVYKEHSNYAYSYTDPVEPPELKLLFVCQYEIETDQSAQRKYIVDKNDIPAQSDPIPIIKEPFIRVPRLRGDVRPDIV